MEFKTTVCFFPGGIALKQRFEILFVNLKKSVMTKNNSTYQHTSTGNRIQFVCAANIHCNQKYDKSSWPVYTFMYILGAFLSLLVSLAASSQVFPATAVSALTQNFRQTPNGTIMSTVNAGNKIVATSVTPDSWYYTFKPSPVNANNTGYVKAGAGYFLQANNTPYVRIQNTSTTGLNVRTGAGVSFAQITINGQMAKVWDGHYFATTGNSQLVSGSTWYQIYLTSDCSQTTGWISNGAGSGLSYLQYYSGSPISAFTINTSSLPGAGGSTTGGGVYNANTSVTVNASANPGYTFSYWDDNGAAVSYNTSYTFTATGNRNLTARFNANPVNYSISLMASPTAGGTVSGGGQYSLNSTATINATANPGYSFSGWEENGSLVSLAGSFSFTVTGNRIFTAKFTPVASSYQISISASPASGGSITGGGQYTSNSNATINASANAGYTFAGWEENGIVVTFNPSFSFTVNGNRTFIARFTQNTINYQVSVTGNPAAGGVVSGGGQYTFNSPATVIANPSPGYVFNRWEESGALVSTSAAFSFTVTGNRNLNAQFTVVNTSSITILSPAANSVQISGGSCVIAASTNAIVNGVEFYYSVNGGAFNYITGYSVNTQTINYTWQVPPGINSQNCKVKVRIMNANAPLEAISGTFSIKTAQGFILNETVTDASEPSHLIWPFESGQYAETTAANWQITRDYWKGGWDGGNPSATGHGSGGHLGGEYYADDYNHVTATGDCNAVFKSPLSGKVIFVSKSCSPECYASGNTSCGNGFGNCVIIQSTTNTNYAFRIAHLNSVFVSLNQYITAGTPVGLIGSTGHSSGSHAHCCLYQKINNLINGVRAIDRLKNGQSLLMDGNANEFAANFKFDALSGTGGGINLIPDDQPILTVYPNPVSDGVLHISYHAITSENAMVYIVNQLGQQILIKPVPVSIGNNQLTVSLPVLPEGIYFLQLANQGGSSAVKFLVKK